MIRINGTTVSRIERNKASEDALQWIAVDIKKEIEQSDSPIEIGLVLIQAIVDEIAEYDYHRSESDGSVYIPANAIFNRLYK
jgi:hypothetical protein